MSSLIRASSPPRIFLHTANVLRATKIHTWGRNAAAIRCVSSEGGAARLTVAHFKTGGPVYDDALSWLGDILGPLLLMLPTNLAAALRQELDSCNGLRVGLEAVADGNLLALLHRDAGDEWHTGAPPHRAPHVYGNPPPGGTPARRGMTSSPPSTTTGFSRTTRGRRSGRRRSAGTTGAASAPACWSSRTPSASGGTTSGSAVSAPGRRPPTSDTPATSAGNATRYPPQRRRAPTGACSAPGWPRAPGPNLPRAGTDARKRRLFHRRIRGAHAPLHERVGPAGAALLWIHVHLRDPTSVAHLSHVFTP